MSRRTALAVALAPLLAAPAYAQNDQILNDITNAYANVTVAWLDSTLDMATFLFATLATIDISWTGVRAALFRRSGDDLLAHILVKIFIMLLLFTLVASAGSWIPFLVGGFTQAGQTVAGFDKLDPSKVFGQGIHVASGLFDNARQAFSWWRMPFWALIAPVAVVIAFTLLAGVMVLTLVEGFIMLGGGVFMLGFAGSRVTINLAQSYLIWVVRVGVKLFVLYLIIAIGSQLPEQWLLTLDEVNPGDPEFFWEVMGGSIILAMLALRIPFFAANLVGTGRIFNMEHLLND